MAIFTIIHRRINRRSEPVEAKIIPLAPTHGRQVKNFVAEYVALEQSCSQAQSRNQQTSVAEMIDRMRAMESRIRFVEAAP